MKRIFTFLLLLFVLLPSFAAGCTTSSPSTPEDEAQDVGIGAFPEELSEEERALCERLIDEVIPAVDLSQISATEEEELFIEKEFYLVERSFHKQKTWRKQYDGNERFLTAKDDLRQIHIPVSLKTTDSQKIVADLLIDVSNKTGYLDTAKQYLRILETAPTFEYLQEYCTQNQLGTLSSVCLVNVEPLNHLNVIVLILQTDIGEYVYDPLDSKKVLDGLGQGEYEQRTNSYANTDYYASIECYHKRLSEQTTESFWDFILEVITKPIKDLFS